jgi:hypothetical protein
MHLDTENFGRVPQPLALLRKEEGLEQPCVHQNKKGVKQSTMFAYHHMP